MFKKNLNQLSKTTKNPSNYLPFIIVFALLAFFLKGVIMKLVNKIKNKQNIKKYQDANSVLLGKDDYGNTKLELINLKSVAQSIYSAFYDNDWFGASEDEQGAASALKKVKKELIPEVAKHYFEIDNKGKDLYKDFNKYISIKEQKKLSIYDLLN